jgi:hypothetical protein
MSFDDLPMIRDEGEMRRVHNETAMYFLSKGLVAHAEMTCHLAVGDHNWTKLAQNPRWRGEQHRVPAAQRVVVRQLLHLADRRTFLRGAIPLAVAARCEAGPSRSAP